MQKIAIVKSTFTAFLSQKWKKQTYYEGTGTLTLVNTYRVCNIWPMENKFIQQEKESSILITS